MALHSPTVISIQYPLSDVVEQNVIHIKSLVSLSSFKYKDNIFTYSVSFLISKAKEHLKQNGAAGTHLKISTLPFYIPFYVLQILQFFLRTFSS